MHVYCIHVCMYVCMNTCMYAGMYESFVPCDLRAEDCLRSNLGVTACCKTSGVNVSGSNEWGFCPKHLIT